MQDVLLDYGDGRMQVQLPDHAVVVRYGKTYTDPPTVDPAEATRKALAAPLGTPPLRQLGGRERRSSSAFRTASRAARNRTATGARRSR